VEIPLLTPWPPCSDATLAPIIAFAFRTFSLSHADVLRKHFPPGIVARVKNRLDV
jgi:hypothetical protein